MGKLLSLCLSLTLCLSTFMQGKDKKACHPSGCPCASQEGSQLTYWKGPDPPLSEPFLPSHVLLQEMKHFFMVKSTDPHVIGMLVVTAPLGRTMGLTHLNSPQHSGCRGKDHGEIDGRMRPHRSQLHPSLSFLFSQVPVLLPVLG